MYVRGCTYDYEDEDWIMRTRWYPSASEAESHVLDRIHRIAYSPSHAAGDPSPQVKEAIDESKGLLAEAADYSLGLAYAGLAIRSLATSIEPALFLGAAPERVLFTGFDSGDWLCVGSLRPEGLTLSQDTERMA